MDDGGATLQAEQPATAVVRGAAEAHLQLQAKLARERLALAGALPEGGKGLPVAGDGEADPALVIDLDMGEATEGEAGAEVITLVADVEVALVAPAALPAQAAVTDKAPLEVDPALVEGDDAAAAGDMPETPAAPAPLRHDAAPRPGELDQLRGGRAQGLAYEQAQQTILAPTHQPNNTAAQPTLGEVALAPDAGKDAREGASTAQLLAGADGGEKSDLKSLKELREACLAAAPAAAKAVPAEATSSSLVDTSSAVRAGSSPVHPTGAAPSGPTDTSLAQLVDRLIETRVAARSERSHIELTHPDFGRVTLAVGLRGDDRLSVDLPGAPTELRHAVGQALAQAGAAQSSGQNAGQNTGNNGNQTASQRSDGQGQAALAGGENPQNSAGHNSGSGKNTYEPEHPQLSIFAQSQAAGSDSGAGRSAGGPESGSRRGVLA
ncbi:MAG: hypothetical protein B7Y88_03390 [Sphingomonadales bacterium 32-64-17]|nr:MAG: hypothetical protein B7Y88_03390 [Sphingomonadales bacterium 32-64-17]